MWKPCLSICSATCSSELKLYFTKKIYTIFVWGKMFTASSWRKHGENHGTRKIWVCRWAKTQCGENASPDKLRETLGKAHYLIRYAEMEPSELVDLPSKVSKTNFSSQKLYCLTCELCQYKIAITADHRHTSVLFPFRIRFCRRMSSGWSFKRSLAPVRVKVIHLAKESDSCISRRHEWGQATSNVRPIWASVFRSKSGSIKMASYFIHFE